MIRRLSILALALAAAAPAWAQGNRSGSPAPAFSPAQNARIDSLAARAVAEFETVPAEKRRFAASLLVNDLVLLGRCSLADPLLRAEPFAARGIAILPYPDMLDGDRPCADRLIALYANALPPGRTEREPWHLYTAGALWRRIGEYDKASEAIEEAERRLEEKEAADPGAGWSCHGGNCINGLWETRLWSLRLTRGTYVHRSDLRWAATLALSQHHAREARRAGPMIGQAVFEELLPLAVEAGDDRLAQLIGEETTYGYPAAIAGERMRLLIRQGRVAEALELWPTAGAAFQAPITPALFRANLSLFHRWREQIGTRHWRIPGELLSLLASAWLERGDPERAREALVTARAQHARKGHDWDPQHVRRLVAVEAMLEGGGDPVAWLARRNPPAGKPSLERDYSFLELASLLAATGRRTETRRALTAIGEPLIRRRILIDLPCRAAYGGEAAAAFAVSVARGHLHTGTPREEKENAFADIAYQTFVCLMQAGRGEAAIAYAQAVEDPDERLTLLAAIPTDRGIPYEAAPRLRKASLGLAMVEARGLWGDERLPYIAGELERAGEFARADRILKRARGAELRMKAYDRLLSAYLPSPAY
ncbi:MAG TPA: hypothetical protein VGB04_09110 [Allosphingosinicella sp.]|jgi:hypothetical protein